MNINIKTVSGGPLSPVFLRQIAATLAAKKIEYAWELIDQADVRDPVPLARALAAKKRLPFLQRLLKCLSAAERVNMHDVIGSLLEGRLQSIAPVNTVSSEIVATCRSSDEIVFLTKAAETRENLAGILIAAIDAVALQEYPTLFQRELTLISLRFDHTKGPSATSALHLRRDGKTAVSRPEWVRGMANPNECPVLYAADFHSATSVFIKAEISTSFKLQIKSPVEIRAMEGGVLGTIDPLVVDFAKNLDEIFEVPLAHLNLSGPSKTDVSWRWEYRVGQGAWHFLARTYHRVYCTPQRPNNPWILSDPDVIANPWTVALDFVCQASNLSGIADNMDGLARFIREGVRRGAVLGVWAQSRVAQRGAGSGDRGWAGGGRSRLIRARCPVLQGGSLAARAVRRVRLSL